MKIKKSHRVHPCGANAHKSCINEMGEEKPEEELMGKRKSSPRLSAILCIANNYNCPNFFCYTKKKYFFG